MGTAPISTSSPQTASPFGKYLLIKRLAVGGMAELFLAQHPPKPELVVIKRILPYLSEEPEFVQMFLDEARIAAQLHHPNVVQVFELGKLENTIFIAMEYVEGIDLRRIVAEEAKHTSTVPYGVAARICAQVAAGLDHAHHSRGVDGRPLELIHRDVSPQNVMVSYDGRVKLVDFGIAKANAAAERSKPGVIKGKFLYLAPEQVGQERLDGRADIFALGVMLYEITTGRSPFSRPTTQAILYAIRSEEPTPPHLLRSDYPVELSRIVMRCLVKDRNQRYPRAAAVQADLEAFLNSGALRQSVDVADYVARLLGEEDERTVLHIPPAPAPPLGASAPSLPSGLTSRPMPRKPTLDNAPAAADAEPATQMTRASGGPAQPSPRTPPPVATPVAAPRTAMPVAAPRTPMPVAAPRTAPPPPVPTPDGESTVQERGRARSRPPVPTPLQAPALRPSLPQTPAARPVPPPPEPVTPSRARLKPAPAPTPPSARRPLPLLEDDEASQSVSVTPATVAERPPQPRMVPLGYRNDVEHSVADTISRTDSIAEPRRHPDLDPEDDESTAGYDSASEEFDAPAPPRRTGLWILLAVVALLLLAGGGFWFLRGGLSGEGAQPSRPLAAPVEERQPGLQTVEVKPETPLADPPPATPTPEKTGAEPAAPPANTATPTPEGSAAKPPDSPPSATPALVKVRFTAPAGTVLELQGRKLAPNTVLSLYEGSHKLWFRCPGRRSPRLTQTYTIQAAGVDPLNLKVNCKGRPQR
ncbi:protein kinase [Myxococcaceae bacterium GXIMD 01537]